MTNSAFETPAGMEEAFGEACNALFLVLKRGRGTVGRQAGGDSLSEAQIALLESVAAHGPISIGEIAQRAGVAQSTASKMLTSLFKKNVIMRTPSSTDDRSVLIDLTEGGRALWEEKRKLLRFYQLDALMRFEPRRRQLVIDVLTELTEIIEDQIKTR